MLVPGMAEHDHYSYLLPRAVPRTEPKFLTLFPPLQTPRELRAPTRGELGTGYPPDPSLVLSPALLPPSPQYSCMCSCTEKQIEELSWAKNRGNSS